MLFQLGVILTVVGLFGLILWIPEAGMNLYKKWKQPPSYGHYWSAYRM